MAKRLILLLASLTALAFAVPSMASAGITEGGSLVPVGASTVNTGSDVTLNSNLLGAITCEKLTFKTAVTLNNSAQAEAAGKEEKPSQAGCKNGAKPVVITIIVVPHFRWRPPFITLSIRLVLHIGTGESQLTCEFTGAEVSGSYTSGTGTYTINSGAVVKGSPTSCGTAKLTGTFALETSSGTGLIID